MSVRIAAEHDPTSSSGFRSQRTVGAEGQCAACGFHARREVDINSQTLSTQRVETVLLVCPDEPEPDRLAYFEEEADSWIAKGQPRKPPVTLKTDPFWRTPPQRDIYAKVPVTPPLSGVPNYGGSLKVDFSFDSSVFDDVLGKMKATLDRMTRDAIMQGTGVSKSIFGDDSGGSTLITREFFENDIRPLVRITDDELKEMIAAGLVKEEMVVNCLSFTPSKSLPYDGSKEAIAAEFRIRKLFLQVRKLKKP